MANAFNKYFVSIGDKLANSRNKSNGISYLNFMNPPLIDNLILQPVTPDEVRSEISRLDQFKSTGPFSIPSKLLKLLQDHITTPLVLLFNCSFATGVVPDKFKLACVIPVFKKGSQTECVITDLFHYYQTLIVY